MRGLALFDFDGTITTKDTMIELLKFHSGKAKFYLGMIWMSPWLVLMKLKILTNSSVKQRVLRHFIGGMAETEFDQLCHDFSSEIIPPLIKSSAMSAIKKYQNQGYHTVLVSASATHWLKYWCEDVGLDCLATQLEVREGVITGNIFGKNCYGPEKVRRIKQYLDVDAYDEIVAFGDSRGDREMLALADEAFYRHFA